MHSPHSRKIRQSHASYGGGALSAAPLRVTLVTGSLGGGGTERVVVWLAESLANAGYAPTLLTLHDAQRDFYDVPPMVKRVKAPVNVALSYRWFNVVGQVHSAIALRRFILDSSPDVVVSFIESINSRVLQALVGSGIPVLASEQTDWRHHPVSRRWRIMRSLLYWRAYRVVVLSSELHQFARTQWPRWRAVHIPNPVPKIQYINTARPERFGRYNVMAMGRLSPEKGFDLLLQAFKSVTVHHPEWSLIIIGEGPERQHLAHQVDELGLGDRVFMPGTISPPFDWLHAGDLFVFSSRYEGFGLALAEAMACGLPVISFSCPSGPQDIIRNEVDGRLVPADDIQALAAAMGDLMSNPEQRRRLASRAPEVCERFAPEKIFAQWTLLIQAAFRESREKG
jgi:GalNAc-alpha-(1->4)-GalNAc-alpha-(1->3)-diNAcBac-PP-undecaprenol alpha-1,4-N-acetyl-D-galactosaminyltransferase